MSIRNTKPSIDNENNIEFADVIIKKPILSLCAHRSITYKDGTSLWSIWLHALSHASSREIITLEKFRGTREDAKRKLQEYIE